MEHLAVCINSKHGRIGFVVSGKDDQTVERIAESFTNRIGYCGAMGESFADAIRRAGMMERDEAHAWGVLPAIV